MKRIKDNRPLMYLALVIAVAISLYIKSETLNEKPESQTILPVSSTVPSAQSTSEVKSISSQAPSVNVATEKKLSTSQMKNDLDILVKNLVEIHPRLLNGWSPEENKVIESAYAKITAPLSHGEFFFIANEIVTMLNDAHTAIYNNLRQPSLDLPLFWTREGLIVTDDRGKFQTGDKVTAIGGRSIEELEEALTKVIPAENNDWLRVKGTDFIKTEFFLEHMGLTSNRQAVVTVQRGAEDINATFKFTTNNSANNYNPYPLAEVDFSYYFDEQLSLGVFQLKSCDFTAEYNAALKRFFEEVHIRGIHNVAVDLRNNGGGDSRVVNEFISYLNVKQYNSIGQIIRFSPQADAAYHYGNPNGTYHKVNPAVVQNQIKTDKPFTGNLYILTSGRTFSSANFFAMIIQDNKLGTILGQPTGNQPSSYGDILGFVLPASNFNFTVSHKKFTRPDPSQDPANSIIPDIEAYTTINDIVIRRDAQIEKLREVIIADQLANPSSN